MSIFSWIFKKQPNENGLSSAENWASAANFSDAQEQSSRAQAADISIQEQQERDEAKAAALQEAEDTAHLTPTEEREAFAELALSMGGQGSELSSDDDSDMSY